MKENADWGTRDEHREGEVDVIEFVAAMATKSKLMREMEVGVGVGESSSKLELSM